MRPYARRRLGEDVQRMYKSKAEWDKSDEKKKLVEKIRQIKKREWVWISGSLYQVIEVKEDTLSVRVRQGLRSVSFSVSSVTRADPQPTIL
jgi:hypothetical protein